MIGLFDSGHGGLTIYRALRQRFPRLPLIYLGDHARAPYGDLSGAAVFELTHAGVERLFQRGCRLVILACNTATAVALRQLQQDWLPASGWQDRNVLGVIAPTVEAATQTPWAVTTPQYPQMYNSDLIVVFATTRTVLSEVYITEIGKRCPRAEVVQQACPELAGAIERGEALHQLDPLVARYAAEVMDRVDGRTPQQAILGCTHYPLVRNSFIRYLPAATRILSQPDVVADSLEHYFQRHQHFLATAPGRPETDHGHEAAQSLFLTTGLPAAVNEKVARFPGANITGGAPLFREICD